MMTHAPRSGFVALAILAAACGGSHVRELAADRAPATALRATEHPVATTPAAETTPTLGADATGTLVVYAAQTYRADGSYAGSRIWYQRLLAGVPVDAPVLVSTGQTEDQLNDVGGDFIVYTAWDTSSTLSGRIVVYEIPTANRTALATAEVVREAKVANGKVAWIQGAPGSATLWLYDLSRLGSGAPAAWIAGPSPSPSDVEIGDRLVVWDAMSGSQRDVHAYDLGTGSRLSIASRPDVDERYPSTDGPWVAYEARPTAGSATRVDLFNVDTAERRVVADGGALNWTPSVSGDLVAYESRIAGNFDVYVYRISERDTFRVTSDPFDQRLTNVFGDLVAYADGRSGSSDVYVSTVAFLEDPCTAGAADADGDGVCDAIDDCPAVADPAQADADGDGAGDACDACPAGAANAAAGCGDPAPADVLEAIADALRSLRPDAFARPHLQGVLLAKLAAVRHMADAGADRGPAAKLEHDLLAKTDGCAGSGSPDANDWVTDCDAQQVLRDAIRRAIEALEAELPSKG